MIDEMSELQNNNIGGDVKLSELPFSYNIELNYRC